MRAAVMEMRTGWWGGGIDLVLGGKTGHRTSGEDKRR